jgi:MoxR-like ATPase
MSTFHRYHGDGRTLPGHDPVARPGRRGRYLADVRLVRAVNTALAVEQPLLVTGEPGCGKTELAWSVASELGLGEVLAFHTRSDHQARDVLYTFDSLRRLFDVQANDARAKDPESYVEYQSLGTAIRDGVRRVVLIDEIDKAPRDFPNDLLDEISEMSFRVVETGRRFPEPGRAAARPIVIITSNSERQLPDAFLRRCVFHRIDPPDGGRLRSILRERLGDDYDEALVEAALPRFQHVREIERAGTKLDKKPATAELIAFVLALLRANVPPGEVATAEDLTELPGIGTLVKTEEDIARVRAAGLPGPGPR